MTDIEAAVWVGLVLVGNGVAVALAIALGSGRARRPQPRCNDDPRPVLADPGKETK